MIAFEIFLNGNKLCRAGVGDLGVLTTVLSWVRRERRNTETREPGNIEEELTLNVSGLISSKNEHVRWSESKVRVGDEVRVRVVSVESVDLPGDRSTEDSAEDLGRQERYVEQMAKRFGWTIHK
jgi:hypothetical protein